MLVRRVTIAVLLIAASAAAASFPPINYRHRTLANGLEVYSIEDHATPTVAINVWYRVGSKNDPEGRSGFAHLFEHIMFKATAHMKSEMMDRLTEDVGGMNNAYTHPDRTVYYEVIPSNYLQTLLWAEGDRMGALTVDDANFKSERDVVKEEYRFRVLAPSYGRFNNALSKDSYAVHPYKRPGIGSIEDLDASTLADVQAFHSTYYRPDNAAVIVAGDFDPKQFDTWVDRYLGSVAKPSTPIPRVTVKEPARAEEKHFEEHGANVPLPAVGLTWLIPPAQNDDTEPLEVASSILSDGDSSRLYQALVYKGQLAQSVNSNAETREDTGLFTVTAVMAGGKKPDDGIAALRQEIDALGAKPVGAAELDKAKNLIITGALRERETNDGKAGALGEAITQFHDAAYVNRGLERLQAVTAADVQRVVKKYLIDAKAVVITYTQEAK
ncbi:MAG TPA: pitrilysin family protein [Thermoanaerobaculia bacterium]|nr:pitrilysin family protein [Thermoanaerobaculia bacterium]